MSAAVAAGAPGDLRTLPDLELVQHPVGVFPHVHALLPERPACMPRPHSRDCTPSATCLKLIELPRVPRRPARSRQHLPPSSGGGSGQGLHPSPRSAPPPILPPPQPLLASSTKQPFPADLAVHPAACNLRCQPDALEGHSAPHSRSQRRVGAAWLEGSRAGLTGPQHRERRGGRRAAAGQLPPVPAPPAQGPIRPPRATCMQLPHLVRLLVRRGTLDAPEAVCRIRP